MQAALRAEGVEDPSAHLAVVQGSRVGTVLMSRVPFDAAEIERLRAVATQRGFAVLWPASGAASQPLAQLLAEGATAPRWGRLRLDPPTDDRPFCDGAHKKL